MDEKPATRRSIFPIRRCWGQMLAVTVALPIYFISYPIVDFEIEPDTPEWITGPASFFYTPARFATDHSTTLFLFYLWESDQYGKIRARLLSYDGAGRGMGSGAGYQ